MLGQYIKKLESVTLVPNNRITLFEALVKSVIGQQLSGKAAHSILSKLKVQVKINGNELRIDGKKKDDLQTVMKFIEDSNIGIPVQFINFRD